MNKKLIKIAKRLLVGLGMSDLQKKVTNKKIENVTENYIWKKEN